MPIPLIPIAIGTLLGVKGPALYAKVKSMFSRAEPASELPYTLDANLPTDFKRDAVNILDNVSSAAVLEKARSFYRTMGFPLTTQLIEAKLSYLRSKG